jgi:hypothetical protein
MEKESDVTGPAMWALRMKQGKNLVDFWGEVAVKKSAGSLYERELRPLPETVRRLCYLHFVCGITVNSEGKIQ